MQRIVYRQRIAVVYHQCESKYNLWLMIYPFGDNMHANARWYTIAFAMDKKFDKSKLVEFLSMGYEKNIFRFLGMDLNFCG